MILGKNIRMCEDPVMLGKIVHLMRNDAARAKRQKKVYNAFKDKARAEAGN